MTWPRWPARADPRAGHASEGIHASPQPHAGRDRQLGFLAEVDRQHLIEANRLGQATVELAGVVPPAAQESPLQFSRWSHGHRAENSVACPYPYPYPCPRSLPELDDPAPGPDTPGPYSLGTA